MGILIKDLLRCKEIIAGDLTILRELLHPDKANLEIRYSLAQAKVKPGQSSLPHRLKTSEVYYILKGEGIMHVDDESAAVHAGQAVYIPPNLIQHIDNTGQSDLEFLCIVDPAWKAEDEEIL
jgi:mannose-6-phosphate isomerase-like protein (cupin superfamily)